MKRIFVATLAAVLVCGCQNRIFTELPPLGNDTPVMSLLLSPRGDTLQLTDYFPQWEGADSVTSRTLAVTPVADDWSAFAIAPSTEPMATTFEVWRDGSCLSVAAVAGGRDEGVWCFSQGMQLNTVALTTSRRPQQIVALWQNCRLPDDSIVVSEDGVVVTIPKDAADYDRSQLRVFAATDSARFNDVVIPLERGAAVTSASQLNRHDFQAQVLYSLMIDRFSNGDSANDRPLNQPDVLPQADYQGGDLKGVTDKIEAGFFDSLGITTIWLSPVTQNPRDAWGLNENPRTRFSGYHGYWPIYTTRVDDRFGSPDQLKALLASAHKRGMNVILDYVANHLHINSPVLQEHPDWVTPQFLPDGRENIGLWDDERLTTWFDRHIPSLDLSREEVCEPMTDSAVYWMAEYDFDGFRHDACKHIPENYWRMLTRKMRTRLPDRKLWQIGETYGSAQLIGSYVRSGMIDAQFDFNVYHTALDVLTRGRSVRSLATVVDESSATYGAHHTMGNITGNHDKARLISLAGGTLSPDEDHKAAGWLRQIGVGDKVGYRKLALMDALITTIPGVPCLYQGDEYGEPGGNDPDNRRMMRFSGYTSDEQAQRQIARSLIALRRETMPLIYGDMTTLFLDDNVWLFARIYMGEYTLVALNVGGVERSVECQLPAGFDRSQKLTANFGNNFELRPDGVLQMTLPAYGFEVVTKPNK